MDIPENVVYEQLGRLYLANQVLMSRIQVLEQVLEGQREDEKDDEPST